MLLCLVLRRRVSCCTRTGRDDGIKRRRKSKTCFLNTIQYKYNSSIYNVVVISISRAFFDTVSSGIDFVWFNHGTKKRLPCDGRGRHTNLPVIELLLRSHVQHVGAHGRGHPHLCTIGVHHRPHVHTMRQPTRRHEGRSLRNAQRQARTTPRTPEGLCAGTGHDGSPGRRAALARRQPGEAPHASGIILLTGDVEGTGQRIFVAITAGTGAWDATRLLHLH